VRTLLLSLGCFLALAAPALADHPVEGTLQGLHEDYFGAGSSATEWTLDTADGRIRVLPTELSALSPDDPRVTVAGGAKDGVAVGAVQAIRSVPAPMLGPRSLAVILVNFASDPWEPWTTQAAREAIFTGPASTNALYQEESYGQLRFTGKGGDPNGDVYGWYTMPPEVTTATCDYGAWRNAARAAAAADGFAASDYNHVMYVVPANASPCAWAGLGTLPGKDTWINGTLDVGVTGHELGHNLGLHHAGGLECGAFVLSDSCTTYEYNDPYDVMGNWGSRHSHGWHLQQLGFLAPSNVQTVTATGTYQLRSALAPTTDTTALRIPRMRASDGSVLDWYYLEVREAGGVFESFAGAFDAATSGVSVRIVDDPSQTTISRLLDMTPGTATVVDSALAVGNTFTDGNVEVTTTAAGGGGATVVVTVGPTSPSVDATAPTAPGSVFAERLADGAVRVSWMASFDDTAVRGYVVLRDGLYAGSTPGTSFVDRPGPGPHAYTVYAEDDAGNRSAASSPAVVTVLDDGATAALGADDSAPRVRLLKGRAGRRVLVLRVSARDNRGVARVRLSIDGRRQSTRRGSMLSYRWNLRRVRAGRHRVVAHAVDAAGNSAWTRLFIRTR
jgi:hypothetical protein